MVEQTTDRPVLLIDAMNAYTRAWAAYPAMNMNGEQMGGTIGFLRIMQKIVRELNPAAIYIAWEGGGSLRRRALYKEYKMNRKAPKLNRFYEDDIPESNDNRKHQIFVLLELLKCLPVCQLYTPDCEGDDVIAYLCCNKLLNRDKVIASSDKDMYQLLNERTRVYSLHKKLYVTQEDVLEEFRVTSQNFAIAKALCGDTSDNIPGIKGMGFKTLAKYFPFLGTEKEAILDEVFNYSYTHLDEGKVYQRVIDFQEDVKRNWKLVHLDGGMLSYQQISKIDACVNSFVPRANKMLFIKTLIKYECGMDFDASELFHVLNCIDGIEHRSTQ